jgi:hypothetical protein
MQNYSASNDQLANGQLVMKVLAKACADSACPTVYQTNRGTLVIQGYAVSAHQAGIDLPAGELLVEIPMDLLPIATSETQ